jgi:hypothetical protein
MGNRRKIRHNYLKIILIFEIITHYYQTLYGHLLKKEGYQGLIYREAVGNLNYFSKSITNKKISFAGSML